MGIKVDANLTQTQNLDKLLEKAGIEQARRDDFESISVIEENNTVNGKQYNTQLQMHLIHGSNTHRKEKRTFASTVYNRMPVGWNNDEGYTFIYDETKMKPLKWDRKEEDLKLLAGMVNSSRYLSQDTKYPFNVKVNEDYTQMEVVAHLASPCYYGKKTYPLKVIINNANRPIFDEEVYVVSALGIPGANLINNDIKETTVIRLTVDGTPKEVTAMVIPYKQIIDSRSYKHSLFKTDKMASVTDITDRSINRFILTQLDDQPAGINETLLGIGKPYRDHSFSLNKKESLRRLINNRNAKEMISDGNLIYEAINNTYSHETKGGSIITLKDGIRSYRINILKVKLSALILKYLSKPSKTFSKTEDSFIYTTDQAYREKFPEERIEFSYTLNSGDTDKSTLTIYGRDLIYDLEKTKYLLAAIRSHVLNKLVEEGVSRDDAEYILGSSPDYDYSVRKYVIKKNTWLIDEKFLTAYIRGSHETGYVPDDQIGYLFSNGSYLLDTTPIYIVYYSTKESHTGN